MTTETYKIPEANLDRLKVEFDRLAKRAVRLGLTPPTYVVGTRHEDIVKVERGGLDETRVEVWYELALTAEVVKLAGWAFQGTLDHSEEATIVRAVPGITLPVSYRSAAPNCEHCKVSRKRNDTFVLLHDDGRYTQVGRQCLADFLGTDPTKAAKNAEYLALFGELLGSGEDEGFGGGGSSRYDVLSDFLGWVALSIRKGGWISRGNARQNPEKYPVATVDTVDFLIEEARKHKGDRPNADDAALAQAALVWIRDVKESATEDLSDYLYNLTTVCASEVVSIKNRGIAGSVIPAYQRASGKAREAKFDAATSEFFGTPKKRAEYTLTLVHALSFDSQYGVRWMLKFRDETGNVAVWWTNEDGAFSLTGYDNGGNGRSIEDSKGRTYLVKATVKGHEDYKGVKQTGLSRVAVLADLTDAGRSVTSSLT